MRLGNKLHTFNIVCWVGLKYMRVMLIKENKPQKSSGVWRGWKGGDGGGSRCTGPESVLFNDWITFHRRRNITKSFTIQDAVFNSLKLEKRVFFKFE